MRGTLVQQQQARTVPRGVSWGAELNRSELGAPSCCKRRGKVAMSRKSACMYHECDHEQLANIQKERQVTEEAPNPC